MGKTYVTDDLSRWGIGVHSILPAATVDDNFWDSEERLTLLEAFLASGTVGVAYITLDNGNELNFHMTDHSIQGPFPIPPTLLKFHGTWLPTTIYAVNDVVGNAGSLYFVNVGHTSALTFDPNATDGHGHDLYILMLAPAGNSIIAGGVTGAVLTKASGTDFDQLWRLIGIGGGLSDVDAPSPVNGDFLSYVAADTKWKNASFVLGEFLGPGSTGHPLWGRSAGQLALADYTLQLTDAQTGMFYVRAFSSSPMTITVADDSLQNFPVGTEFDIHQDGTGQVTVAGPFITLNVPDGMLPKIARQGGLVRIKKTNANLWDLTGDLLSKENGVVTDLGVGIAGAIPFDPSPSKLFSFTPSGDFQLNASLTRPIGKEVVFIITTSGTVSYSVTFNVNFVTQGPLATGTVSGKKFAVKFVGDGNVFCEISRTAAM